MRGTYTLTYSAADVAGNVATATREVVVRSGAAHLLEAQYGLQGANAGLAEDADRDGAANMLEYAFGTDRTLPGSAPSKGALVINPVSASFTAMVRSGDASLTVNPQISTDLRAAWSGNGITEVQEVDQSGVPSGFRRRSWQVEGVAPSTLFIRLGVSYE